MGKHRKLNKGQLRRMRANQQKRLQQVELAQEPDDASLGAPEPGIIVSRFGQHAVVANEQDQTFRCHIRRSIETLVCGDEVVWRRLTAQTEQTEQGVIEAVQPRHSLLSRPDYYDGLKPVAANIDQILIISSVLPAFSAQIIDRYLVACEDIDITPVIVLNKADLLETLAADAVDEIEQTLTMYEAIGYQVLRVSAKTLGGLDAIQSLLQQQVSIVVGQSGVGKSSLVNALLPEIETEVGDVSAGSGLGQHTTTVATRYPLPQGGYLIDSPGIREFALWHLDENRVAWCFKDFRPFLGRCKFRDCKHLPQDPGCALQEAVESGDLHALRLYNFHKIIESMASTKPSRAIPRGSKK
ncbi:small ribosomal subunit biogenesis GTPase RsgA [Pseudidiomarina insulisalsae]|uniref:Small ribosomal subunit biogenesis GTPase RsgA n=1 Tax=Pseudidiomarina insulisalsae TaxID=575789 RepID=A0A432YQA4_9GAMM|nr:small ribosomal subunit biogenesis GTPase RsgA [Pseudidiomarina insulisalsae]RUO63517.1 ribosome biogenesis GTPase RsgA [Pseudidiomarina insulisalsae]